ncbi:D-glycero-beta-D-manno-heptose-7-phosphate kinase [Maridesulfovibrio ferrireducens]|uniref:D-glycero-beta-D-manno-heptose-7-phosphate kinase n=1 Tax=Maridesulfovibrio ferrireducens TaxID=246191 RepID=UPI001A326F7C|nr:D-glycero-beta-D-manno-heptose-7-phosphate kinase [Maridesulfovibrio ferrireducens]MBI9111217.1 D-glycero-beta-D-manno-heptose-7-phosphate kinase [Maridesulfovibrio ferrireducens]
MDKKILSVLPKLKGQKVLIVGDVMLDHYVIGSVDRISPEAPVPVVQVTEEKYLLGGAGNVARNIVALGGDPHLTGFIGADAEGHVFNKLCLDSGISCSLLESEDRPTTKKTRVMAHNQQMVRVDREKTDEFSVYHMDQLFSFLDNEICEYSVVILSDYGKGTLSQKFFDRFWALLKVKDHNPHVLVDPKTVNYDHYKGVNLLTPNAKEAGEGAGMVIKSKDDVLEAGRKLFDRLDPTHLLITLGGDGMALFESRDVVKHVPTFAQKVFDVTGAGDTVIATLGLGLAAGLDPLTSAVLANYAAGIVVGQVGAATATVEELAEAVRNWSKPKITTWS